MKRPGNQLLLAFVFLFLFNGCESTDDGQFVEPISIYEKINGSWRLTKITMEDNYAKANSITPDEQNITSWFDFTTFKLELNVNANFEPTTFKVNGTAPELFIGEGYWDLSNAFPVPGQSTLTIRLYSDASKSDLRDKLQLSSIPGASPGMQIRLQRASNKTLFLTYTIDLVPDAE